MSLNTDMIARPDALSICSDDTAIQELLVELGFSGPPPVGKGKVGWTQFMGIVNHPTHWICIGHHVNYPKPEDNGYQMIAFPKLYVSEAEANARFNVMMKHQFVSGNVPTPFWVDATPSRN